MSRLKDKIAFISGAANGIGRATACRFAEEGAKVVIADIDTNSGIEVEKLIQNRNLQNGGEALFMETDISDLSSTRSAIKQCVKIFGGLNILHNNAGGSTMNDNKVTEASEEEFWRVIKLDLFGTFVASKCGIPEIIKSGGGSVINMASNMALMGMPGRDCYTAAKGGIASLTRSMAVEFAPENIRVNAIAPSVTTSERVKKFLEEDPKIIKQNEDHLLGFIKPVDVANLAVYLASDESNVLTGQIIPIDSGITIS